MGNVNFFYWKKIQMIIQLAAGRRMGSINIFSWTNGQEEFYYDFANAYCVDFGYITAIW